MINQTTKDKIEALHQQYIHLAKGNEALLLIRGSLVQVQQGEQ